MHIAPKTVQGIDAEDMETTIVRVDGQAVDSWRKKEADREEKRHTDAEELLLTQIIRSKLRDELVWMLQYRFIGRAKCSRRRWVLRGGAIRGCIVR